MNVFKSCSGQHLVAFFKVSFAIALVSPVSFAAERNDILFESSFESGSIKPVDESVDGWSVVTVDPAHAAITTSVSRDSNRGIRLFIDKDLDYSAVNGNGEDKPRINLSKYNLKFDYQTDYWIAWSVLLPSSWVDDLDSNWTTVMQLKQPIGGSPILSMNVKGGNWEIVNRRDANDVTWNQDTSIAEVLYSGSTIKDKGQWVDFVLNFRLCESVGCDGNIKIWKNGVQIVNQNGANAYRRSEEDGGPFFTLNLYKHGWKRKDSLVQTRELFFDAVRIGGPGSDYASVAPDGIGVGYNPPPKPMPPTLNNN